MLYFCFRRSEDLLAYDCPLPINQLSPVQQLQWNVSKKTAEKIEAAKVYIDRLVNFSTSFIMHAWFAL